MAIAAKNARMAWAVLNKGEAFKHAGVASAARHDCSFHHRVTTSALMSKGWTCAGSA